MRRSNLGVAVAGTGFIGAVHARSARLAGARLVGVAASTPERSERAADELGAERAFATAEELATDPAVDVVHICTPNHLHEPLAEAALAAGKHVICEKPLALDGEGADRLVDLARGTDRLAAVPFVYRYYPTVREAREHVRSGAAGQVRLVHGTYLQDWLSSPADDNWRVDDRLGGASRAFADIGSHWCDLAEFVSGHRISRLNARTMTAMPERSHDANRAAFATNDHAPSETREVSTEDAAVVQFEFDGGALGSVVISQISPGRRNRLWLEVDGSEEGLTFWQEEPETLRVGRRDGISIVNRDPALMSPPAARLATLPAGHPQGYADCFDLFVADAYAAIDGETPDGMPVFADGLRAARITDAVLASARDQRWVDVPAPAQVAS